MKHQISWSDFEKIDMRTGTIVEAKVFEEVRNPAFRLIIDFGPEIGLKKSSAQITALYDPKTLIGQQVIAIINFPPKQIANMMSECLILGIPSSKGVVLLQPEQEIENGLSIA